MWFLNWLFSSEIKKVPEGKEEVRCASVPNLLKFVRTDPEAGSLYVSSGCVGHHGLATQYGPTHCDPCNHRGGKEVWNHTGREGGPKVKLSHGLLY